MNILICGGSGYLGGLIANSLCNNHNIIVGTRRLDKIKNYKRNITFKKVNYNSLKNFNNKNKKIDLIIHLVGMNKSESINNPKKSLELKRKATLNIIKLSKIYNCKIFYFSSIQVYENFDKKKIINEKSKLNYSNSYAKAHILTEKILLSKLNNLNKVIILRLSSVFGTNILNSSKELIFTLANNFCYQAIKKNNIIVKNPSLVRNFLPSQILINILNLLISKNFKRNKIFNLGYKTLTLETLSNIIKERAEKLLSKKCILNLKNKRKKNKNLLIYKSNFLNLKYNKSIFYKEIDNLLKLFKKKYI
tara:strand:- start:536 stop:1453 length:918 start_codon:yes stop_codon:yes gene_type:complete